MSPPDIAAALQRARAVYERRPDKALHDDSLATASWQRGLRVVTRHANGTTITTDMPIEFGGGGDVVTPGWPFRAGLAACAATSIAMVAAAEGVALTLLEVRVGSRSDARGSLGMREADGRRVESAPQDMRLQVRIGADGVPAERLRAVVEEGYRCSPCPAAVLQAVPIDLRIETGAAAAAGD